MNTENDLNVLHRLLSNLYEIKSASYDLVQRRFLSEGSVPVFENSSFYREIIDPKDLRVGARFIETQLDDHDKLIFLYDGKMRVEVDWQERTMRKQLLEFVTGLPVTIMGPFFTRIKGLIKFALNSGSVEITWIASNKLVIYFSSQMIMPVGRNVRLANAPTSQVKAFSRFQITFDHDLRLPLKLQSENLAGIHTETIDHLQINNPNLAEIDFKRFIPEGFSSPKSRTITPVPDLTGEIAPEWELMNIYGGKISLSGLTGKVVLLHFTSVFCGPCGSALSFMKKLGSLYPEEELSLVSIETRWQARDGIREYMEKKEIDHRYLIANEQILQSYQVRMVPVFYLLDKNRSIHKIFSGYSMGTTDKEILSEIGKFLDS